MGIYEALKKNIDKYEKAVDALKAPHSTEQVLDAFYYERKVGDYVVHIGRTMSAESNPELNDLLKRAIQLGEELAELTG